MSAFFYALLLCFNNSNALTTQENWEKSGLRFWKKAMNASLASGAVNMAPKCLFSSCILDAIAADWALFIKLFVKRNDAGGNATNLAAWAYAYGSKSACGSTLLTKLMS